MSDNMHHFDCNFNMINVKKIIFDGKHILHIAH